MVTRSLVPMASTRGPVSAIEVPRSWITKSDRPVKKLESPNECRTTADTTGTTRSRRHISRSMGPPLMPQTGSRTPRFRGPPRARPPVPEDRPTYGWRRASARSRTCPEYPTVTGRPSISASPPSGAVWPAAGAAGA